MTTNDILENELILFNWKLILVIYVSINRPMVIQEIELVLPLCPLSPYYLVTHVTQAINLAPCHDTGFHITRLIQRRGTRWFFAILRLLNRDVHSSAFAPRNREHTVPKLSKHPEYLIMENLTFDMSTFRSGKEDRVHSRSSVTNLNHNALSASLYSRR